MSTVKQKMALAKIVENRGNVTQAMRAVGYSEATINNPSSLTKSKGYRVILTQLGLTEEFIVQKLIADIESKPEKRLGELILASDILGLRKRNLIIDDKSIDKEHEVRNVEWEKEMAYVFNQYYKAKLSGYTSVSINIVQ